MFRLRKLAAVICAVCILMTFFAGTASADRAEAGFTGRIRDMSLNENGYFQITRERAKNEPMGEEDSWTIFVYLCGSDLETNGGLASSDLQEMIDGSKNSRVRYVVLTGGALEWHNTMVESNELGVYLVEGGYIRHLQSQDYYYMNDPDVLRAFLSWGVKEYPADKMGLVFWDHGGGSISGVCTDQIFFDDLDSGYLEDSTGYTYTLTLPGIAGALSQVYDEMTDQFEFIGYDACLMGTLENAFILSPYARYLYASEEVEPGCGWDYIAMGQAIGEDGRISGAELGQVVCDSYFAGCEAIDRAQNATLSCIDLSQMDDLALEFDLFGVRLLNASADPGALSAILQKATRAESFGGNSDAEGYTNMVDLAALAGTVSAITGSPDDLLAAVNQAVTYTRSGSYHQNACGLSVYYPLHVVPGSGDLGRYAEVACSPYYYGYVAQSAYAAANGGTDGYDLAVSLNTWASIADSETENLVEDYGDAQVTGESPYVVFWDEPQLLEDGTYGFSLTDESIPYISSVEANIWFVSDDGEDLVFLGSTNDIVPDWENGVFLDNFDGLWFCMPDGQLVSATLVNELDDCTIYTTPVLLNGEETNLRFVVDLDYNVTLDGVWSGVDAYGLAGRDTYELQIGDVIQPLFNASNLDTDEQLPYYGLEYEYDGSNDWYYNSLFDATYLYQFCIYDIYGDYYATDSVLFTVSEGEIYFDLE